MRTKPQQNEDNASNTSGGTKPHTEKTAEKLSKHWQTECHPQRVQENNRTQRYTMQQDKNTICRQN